MVKPLFYESNFTNLLNSVDGMSKVSAWVRGCVVGVSQIRSRSLQNFGADQNKWQESKFSVGEEYDFRGNTNMASMENYPMKRPPSPHSLPLSIYVQNSSNL